MCVFGGLKLKIKSKLFQIKKKILRVLEGANTNCFLGKMMVFRSVIKVYKKLEKTSNNNDGPNTCSSNKLYTFWGNVEENKTDLIKKTTKMDFKFYEQLMTVNVKKFCNFI